MAGDIDYSGIEDSIKTTFSNDSWFGNSANVQTIRARFPRAMDESNRILFGLEKGADLPGVIISTRMIWNGDRPTRDDDTTAELIITIPFVILGIIFREDQSDAEEAARDLLEEIERVIHDQVKAAVVFGEAGDIVPPDLISSDYYPAHDGASGFVGIAEMNFSVQRIFAPV